MCAQNLIMWSTPEFIDAGCADPQLLRVGGSLVFSGGRYVSNGTSDVLLWLNEDGMATSWEQHSISVVHNRLEKNPGENWRLRRHDCCLCSLNVCR
jgi:hypothetical protein